ncbi:endonuclease/exonuclease/phosphatase family protein [Candidatus Sumerlaeota bacterium]|nr:endonuclease/exonuclease/phosphatase family protein [Candidatus Sumerlaeota bacterium]
MRRSLLALIPALALACAGAPLDPPTPSASADAPAFTVATWNMQHFVDEYDNPYYPRDTDEEFEKSEAQLEAIAEALRALNADVVAFEEVEGTALLRAFVEERLPDMGYEHFASAPDDGWHQNVAVMSRLPLGPLTSMGNVVTEFVGYDEEPTDLINDRLMAIEVYPTPDHTFLLVAVHLKAGGRDRDRAWRTGQIAFLRGWLDMQRIARPDLNICILGDFNCTPDSEEMGMWLRPESGEIYRSVLPEVDTPPTHPSWEPRRTIDNILVNGAMAPELIEGSGSVFSSLGPLDGEHRCSDHLPVSAAFRAADR